MKSIPSPLSERPLPLRATPWKRSVLGRLWGHRGARAGIFVLSGLVVMALLGPILTTHDPLGVSLRERLKPPSSSYWLGTDGLGRDIYTRILYGARYSLYIGLLATTLSAVIGVPIGLLAGFYAGSQAGGIDTIFMRVMDVILAFPEVLLALVVVSALGPSLQNAIIAVGVVGIPVYARLGRASVLTVKEREFVLAARVNGASDFRIVTRHILPNSVQPLIVQGTLGMATAILVVAALSFLGLGATPPTPEWGAMLLDGRGVLETAPWVGGFPGLAIFAVVIGINLLGDGLRDALDPRIVVI